MSDLVTKTRDAFAYIQQLYKEVALLLFDLTRDLNVEQERFVMALPKGNGVVSRGSLGLDLNLVQFWPMRKFSVFFVPAEKTTRKKGKKTATPLAERVLYVRVLLDEYQSTTVGEKPLQEPTVLYGVMAPPTIKRRFEKLEQLLIHLEYNGDKVFARIPDLSYEDSYIHLRGTFQAVPLHSLTDPKAVHEHLIKPALALYRAQSSETLKASE